MNKNNEKIEQKLIGIKNNETCSSTETQKQIDNIIQYDINIFDEERVIQWSDVYDKTNKEERALFNSIIADRKQRVDKKELMADRPRFAVCTIINGVCERVEFYEGHDELEKTYDLRSKNLKNKKLEDYLTKDENAYNPLEFLKQSGLIKSEEEKMVGEILDILHSSNEKELREKADKYFKDKK